MSSRYPEPRKVSLPRLTFRFLTGRPLDGIRRTDSIFLKPGRQSLDPSGWASRWSYLAGYQRLLIRLSAAYIAGWILILTVAWMVRSLAAYLSVGAPGWSLALTPTQVLVRHVAWVLVLGAGPGTYYLVRRVGVRVRVPALVLEREGLRVRVRMEGWTYVEVLGRRTWDRTKVRPVAAAAQNVLGTTYHPRESRKWVQVPRDYRSANGSPVVIRLPRSFTGADEGTKRRLVSAVGSRLGMKDPSAAWELEGDQPRVLISSPPLPPNHVTFADVRQLMEDAPEYELVLGLAARGEAMKAHLAGDSPHVAVSAGSGAGKSEQIKAVIMQALRWGWGVIILDWKEVSHQWVDGLPGVIYCRDVEDIHDMAIRLGEEVDIRKRAYRTDPSMPGRSKILIVAEEMNVTSDLLQAYWERLRTTAEPEEKRSMPGKSPALRGLQAVNFGGRQFQMFMVYIAQRFSARVTNGNADLRESFQTRLLARCSTQTQKMLAGHIKPFPEIGVQPGRWVAVIGPEATVYQAPLITDEEAREFAMGGLENPPSPLTSVHRPSVPSQRVVDVELEGSLGHDLASEPARSAPVDARKLSEMVEGLSHLDVTLDVLRNATKRPEEQFPSPIGGSPNRGYTYDYAAVQEWARKRHAARAAEKEVRS